MTVSSDASKMDEMRRLLAERAAKKRELDSIDQAIELVAGVTTNADRPKRPRLNAKDFRAACGIRA